MPPQQPERPNFSQSTEMIYKFAMYLSVWFTVPIRSNFGCEYPGYAGLWAFLLMPVFGAFVESEYVILWWQMWTVVLIFRRIGVFIRERKGNWEDPHYHGWSWLASRFPWRTTNEHAAERREPWFYLLAGYLVAPYDGGLSVFFYTGFGSLAVLSAIHGHLLYKEKLALRSAQLAMKRQEQLYRENSYEGR